jgi:BirA family biotin operon repressor/biotin-[acetyl-CoA-carboxylase] ligase
VGPTLWPAEAIWEAIYPTLADFSVEILPELDSTNTELMRRARAGRLEPVLLVAERQTAGRGRLGREWHSAIGDSLTFSLGLPLSPPDWSGLSLAVGVSVAESLHKNLQLKWPNDLWLTGGGGDRKLGGILVETASVGNQRYAAIGVGINVAARDGAGLATPPACLHELDPGLDAPQALLRLVPALVQTVLAFGQFGFAPFQARFNARDVLRERAVRVTDGQNGVLEGTAHGVGESGALLVHTALGMKQITSSEVSVRPATGPAAASGKAA